MKREFLGQSFSYETPVNKEGKTLWTKEIDNLFSQWIHRLRDSNRDLFKVQYSISENASSVLGELKEKLGVYDESLLVRAITITFINFIDTRKGHQIVKKLNSYRETDDYKTLVEGESVKKNLYFSALGMRDVEAYSKLTGLKKPNVVKNALYSVLLISINEDEEIKKFWEKEILEKLTTIFKAA